MKRIETLGDVGGVQPLRTALSLASLQVLLHGVGHGPLMTGLPFMLLGPTSPGLSIDCEVYSAVKFDPMRVKLCENPSRTPFTLSEFPGCH